MLESDKSNLIGTSQSAAELLQFNIFKSYEEDQNNKNERVQEYRPNEMNNDIINNNNHVVVIQSYTDDDESPGFLNLPI